MKNPKVCVWLFPLRTILVDNTKISKSDKILMRYISDMNNKLENSCTYKTVVGDGKTTGLKPEQIKERGMNLSNLPSL